MPRRPVPRTTPSRRSATRSPTTAVAVERRRHRLPGRPGGRRARLPRDARAGATRRWPRRGRWARPAAASGLEPVRAERAEPRRPAPAVQAAAGWTRCGRRRRVARRRRRRAGRAVRRLEHRPARRGRLGHGRLRHEHARLAAGAGRLRRGRRGRLTPTSSARTPPGEFTYWDYTQLRFPRREGMRIDFVLASPALQARVTGALSTGRSARARAPATMRPSWSTWPDHESRLRASSYGTGSRSTTWSAASTITGSWDATSTPVPSCAAARSTPDEALGRGLVEL